MCTDHINVSRLLDNECDLFWRLTFWHFQLLPSISSSHLNSTLLKMTRSQMRRWRLHLCFRLSHVSLSPIICSLKFIVLPWLKLAIYMHGCTPVRTSPLWDKEGEKKWHLISKLIIFSICFCALISLLTSFFSRHHLWRQQWVRPYCLYWLVCAHWWVEYWVLFISIQVGVVIGAWARHEH